MHTFYTQLYSIVTLIRISITQPVQIIKIRIVYNLTTFIKGLILPKYTYMCVRFYTSARDRRARDASFVGDGIGL